MNTLQRVIFNLVKPKETKGNPAEQVGSTKLYTVVSQRTNNRPVDLSDFVTAIDAAESTTNPLRYLIYGLYDRTIDYDSSLANAIDLRRLPIRNKKIVYTKPDGTEDEQMTAWLQSPSFKKFIIDIFDTQLYGITLFDFSEYAGGEWFNYDMVNRKHIDPIRGMVYVRQNGGAGVSYNDPARQKYTMVVGEKYDLGLLKTIVPDCIFKRNLRSDWANYAELAGNNFTLYKVKSNDPKLKNQINLMSKDKGAGGSMTMPDGVVDVETINSSSSQQNELFEGFYNTLDKNIITRILGANMTVQDGSSRSQAEVHQDTTSSIHEADLRYILDVLNFQFADFLPLWGKQPTGIFSYAEDSLIDPLAVRLGVGGTQSLQSILVDTTLTEDQKKNIIVILFGIGEAEADLMVNKGNKQTKKTNDPNQNQQDE